MDAIDYFRRHFLPNHTHELIHFIYHSDIAKEQGSSDMNKLAMEVWGLEMYIKQQQDKGDCYF